MEGTYLITGITGFLGSVITKNLMEQEDYKEGNIRIVGITRNKQNINSIFSNYDTTYLDIIEADIRDGKRFFEKLSICQWKIEYIIHCAADTSSNRMVKNPVEVADGILLGTKTVLEYARSNEIKSMVYLSSVEVYGVVKERKKLYSENELGEILIERERSCYPMSKRMAEHYCCLYHKQYKLPIKIARLAQIFGRGVRENDNRVFCQFARAVLEERDIVFKTDGQSMGNYCETMDAVRAIFLLLKKGNNGEIYNVVNENNTMTIEQMAELVCKEFGNSKVNLRFEIEDEIKTGYAATTKVKMSSEKIKKLGWIPQKNLKEMYCDLLDEIKSKDIFCV